VVVVEEMAVEIGKATAPATAAGSYGEMEEQNQRLESERNLPDPSMKGKSIASCGTEALCTTLGSVLLPIRWVPKPAGFRRSSSLKQHIIANLF